MQDRSNSKSPLDNGLSRRQILVAAASTAAATATLGAAAQTSSPRSAVDESVLDVVVIGAGLAGLTAARDLQLAGCESFVVLEGNDRVGGRTLNHHLQNGHYSEAGGQWVGPGQTAVYDLCRELNIGMHPTYLKGKSVYAAQDGSLYEEDSGGGFSVSPNMQRVVDKLNELAADVPSGAAWTAPKAKELDALSLADFIEPYNLEAMDLLSFDVGFRLTDTIHYQEVSLLYALSRINYAGSYEQLEGFTGGAQEQRIENGSQYISEVMAQQVGDRLHLSSPVRKITDWDSDTVSVHSDSGVYRARRVILAISPALCNKVQFQPELPQARRELQQGWPGYSPGRKTCHVYERPFWRDMGYNGWFFTIGGEVMWAYDNSPEDESIGVINAFIYPSMPNDPDVLAPMLANMYARAFGDEALRYTEFHDQDWGQEPWCPACVSPLTPGFLTSGLMPALRDPIGGLVWSGTETAEIWHTYMDGAVRSGHRAALEALHGLSQSQRV
ncbi:putative amine oxidase [flavin-containing] B [gamma proteobacterium NOR5-3]|nr:putative amine oxidase [flavin-containing] B [gamma proteobacterium NOR5-3]